MNRRLVTALGASLLLVAALLPATASVSASAPEPRFEPLDVRGIDPALRPAIVSNRQVTVMVELAGEPAISGQGRAKQAASARGLQARQDALGAAIAKAGGRVLADYQYVYNGIKVRVAARKVPALAGLPGVAAVRGIATVTPDNAHSVPFIGAPAAWDDLGATGKSQIIAVIDTGIDYTHADFGGPGTAAAYKANKPTVVEKGTFPTAKVIGGYDFSGNDYDASGQAGSTAPAPDRDPLDCAGHGSHVAGTAAGFGVSADGRTFRGPYDSSTPKRAFAIGPGVAPEAKLIALKIFGCQGASDLTTDALEWVGRYNATHAQPIGVVNMSLGSTFGQADDPASQATDNLVANGGVAVVVSAGNSGPNAYAVGSPAVATNAIAVAAEDTLESFPGAVVDFASASDITDASNQNAWPHLPVSGDLKVLFQAPGVLSLGCTATDYGKLAPDTIVVVQRGVCPFTTKGAAAASAGAVGIVDVNRDDIPDPKELPTFIGYDPTAFNIPMVGVGNGDKKDVIAADGQAVTLDASGPLANPTFRQPASFTSGGPRNGDSAAKPDLTAPGVSIVSTLIGSGNGSTTLSGTSMSSPHAAGVAALVRDANPSWGPGQVKAAMMNTASDSSRLTRDFAPRVTGAGLVQPRKAASTGAVATTGDFTASLSYGYDPLGGAWSKPLPVTITNTGKSSITYDLAADDIVHVPDSVTVHGGDSVTFEATASLSRSEVAGLPTASVLAGGQPPGGVNTFSGAIVATPRSHGSAVYPLRIPFVGVPRGLSEVKAGPRSGYELDHGTQSARIPVANDGVHDGTAELFAWGLDDPQDIPAGPNSTMDIRAVGVETLPAEALTGKPDPNDRGVVFAINTYGRWSTAAENEFDIAILNPSTKQPAFFVVGVDHGAATTGEFDGIVASLIFDASLTLVGGWVADAPANGSTILLPALASQIGQGATSAGFAYRAGGFSLQDSALSDLTGFATFSVSKPALTSGDSMDLRAGDSGSFKVSVDKPRQAATPALGWMVVTLDDPNGPGQADLIPVGGP